MLSLHVSFSISITKLKMSVSLFKNLGRLHNKRTLPSKRVSFKMFDNPFFYFIILIFFILFIAQSYIASG